MSKPAETETLRLSNAGFEQKCTCFEHHFLDKTGKRQNRPQRLEGTNKEK